MTMREKIDRAVTRAMLTGKPISDAVLDAMREPTKAMLDKGITAAENVEDWGQDSYETYRVDSASDMPRPVWQAMIDAAKEER